MTKELIDDHKAMGKEACQTPLTGQEDAILVLMTKWNLVGTMYKVMMVKCNLMDLYRRVQ